MSEWKPGQKGVFFYDFNVSQSGSSGPQSAKPGRFSLPKPAFFSGVVAGIDGLTRRWNCGGGKVARSFLDFPDEKFSAGQVVCASGNAGRRWGEKPTRCDPKCGHRVGASCDSVENDRLSVLEAGVLDKDRLLLVLEAGVRETDRLFTELEAGASMVRASASRQRVSEVGESQHGRRAARQAGAGFRPLGRRGGC